MTGILGLAEDLSKPQQRAGLSQVFHILRTWYRDLLVAKAARNPSNLVNIDLQAEITSQAGRFSTGQIQRHLARIRDAEQAIFEHTANARLVLESLFIDLTTEYTQGGQT